jgi:hypothetical protein
MARDDYYALKESKKADARGYDAMARMGAPPSQAEARMMTPSAPKAEESMFSDKGSFEEVSSEPAEVSRVEGSGGYEYATMSDGSVKITKSPKGGVGTVVGTDSPFYALIMGDIGNSMAKARGADDMPMTGFYGGDARRGMRPPRAGY